jgi:hypothetical protein
VLFSANLFSGGGRSDEPRTYDVTGGGDQFVAIRPEEVPAPELRLGILTHWTATLGPPAAK